MRKSIVKIYLNHLLENCEFTEEAIGEAYVKETGGERYFDEECTLEQAVADGFVEKDGDNVVIYYDGV